LNGKNHSANPSTFTTWMDAHDGFTVNNGLRESVVPLLNPPNIRWVESVNPQTGLLKAQLRYFIDTTTRVVIAEVRNNTHFVLVIGYDSSALDTFYVNDPAFNSTFYDYNDIDGWRIFDMWGK